MNYWGKYRYRRGIHTFVPDDWVLRRSSNESILDPASYPKLDNLVSASPSHIYSSEARNVFGRLK